MMDMNPIDNNLQYSNPQQTYFAPPPKSSKKSIIVVLVVIVALGAVGGITYMVQQGKINDLNTKVASLNKQLDDTQKAVDAATATANNTPAQDTTNTKDVEKESDIKAVAAQLEAYNTTSTHYPTFANLNDAKWLAANLKGLDKEATRDPDGTSYKFLSSSTAKQYGYAPTKDDGTACDNISGNGCTKFTLTYTTEGGTQQTVTNL